MGSTKVPGLLHDEAKTPIQTGSFESEYEILESIARGRYAEVKKMSTKKHRKAVRCKVYSQRSIFGEGQYDKN